MRGFGGADDYCGWVRTMLGMACQQKAGEATAREPGGDWSLVTVRGRSGAGARPGADHWAPPANAPPGSPALPNPAEG